MGIRVASLALLSAILIADSAVAAEDRESYTKELPPVEISPPKTAVSSGRPRNPLGAARPAVPRLRVYPITSLANPSTALAVDKVPSSINFVGTGQIERTGSLNITDALQQYVAAINIKEVSGNPYQPSVEFRGFVGSPV